MKLLLVVNPISGGVDKEPFLKKAVNFMDFYGIEYRIFKTTGIKDDEHLKEALADFRPDRVASVGGDGTTLFTGIALMGTKIPMGIVPLGSANGMAVELGVNEGPMAALRDIILSQHIHGLDMLLVNEKHYSIHIGDVGVNAHIVEAYEKDPNRGMLTYAKYFLEELKRLKNFKVKVVVNGVAVEENVFMAGFCNARKFGTGVPLNTISNPMDGEFEIVLLNRLDSAVLIKAGLSKFSESFVDLDYAKVISAKQAEVYFEEPQLLQLDGEVIGVYEKLDIRILKSAVHFITHRGNPYLKEALNKTTVGRTQ